MWFRRGKLSSAQIINYNKFQVLIEKILKRVNYSSVLNMIWNEQERQVRQRRSPLGGCYDRYWWRHLPAPEVYQNLSQGM